jgi:aryl-alcohol dehydrogenase-like predicted oxidoreductase
MSLNGNLGGRVTPRVFDAVEAYLAVARDFDVDPVHMALAWSARRPFVASSIFGATTLEQLEHALNGLEVALSDALLARLDEVHKQYPMPY